MDKNKYGCVLLIEDDVSIREVVKEILEQEGYSVFTAENGKVGIDVLNSVPSPCLILLDLFMPVMSGIDFLETLQKDNHHIIASLPIVVISASPPEGEAAKAVRPLINGFIKKPVDLDVLFKIVEKYCYKCRK